MDFGNFVNQQEETNEETILDYQFNWDVNENKNDSDSDDEEEIVNKKEKINKNERSIEMLEKRLLQENDPETLDDFERLVASNPNDSFTWVRYMAFHLKLSEIDKARNVAEKALKSISFRNEQEKFNVWMALINLENKFGSEISLNQTIERSLQFNEPKKVYLQLAKIYESTNKTIEATNLWQSVILKKFSHSCKAFVEAANFFVRINKIEIARSLLNKALKSLDKRKHVKVVNKFAQLEYKFGDVERARTLFEGLLANYPKRLDLWSIYIDMEIKLVKQSKESFKSVAATLAIESVRRLFERVLSLKFSVKKKKFLFKKYLDFENVYGNEESVNHVKQLAIDYVNQL
ncbi:protein prenylyltransferase [Rozella allomycis CSF55]|uniref:Protein prenylyltransferase n=1 Tax=Rozella allomycis (strain CSF55) TaxID=988480 RepID=A0A4P9YCE6_ROZAC|nr:protein prenylyltransferase [Rozella allomycis CSF55]